MNFPTYTGPPGFDPETGLMADDNPLNRVSSAIAPPSASMPTPPASGSNRGLLALLLPIIGAAIGGSKGFAYGAAGLGGYQRRAERREQNILNRRQQGRLERTTDLTERRNRADVLNNALTTAELRGPEAGRAYLKEALGEVSPEMESAIGNIVSLKKKMATEKLVEDKTNKRTAVAEKNREFRDRMTLEYEKLGMEPRFETGPDGYVLVAGATPKPEGKRSPSINALIEQREREPGTNVTRARYEVRPGPDGKPHRYGWDGADYTIDMGLDQKGSGRKSRFGAPIPELGDTTRTTENPLNVPLGPPAPKPTPPPARTPKPVIAQPGTTGDTLRVQKLLKKTNPKTGKPFTEAEARAFLTENK